MQNYTATELAEIIRQHQLWLNDEGGKRANLRGANLRGAVGNLEQMKSIFLDEYPITYTAEVMQIGCKRYKINDWWQFDDEQILKMDGKRALKFWRKYKEFIKQAIELSPATPTGKENE